MKKILIFSILLLLCISTRAQKFDDCFEDRTLRLDYIFAGDVNQQQIYIDELVSLPHWHGRRERLSEVPLIGNGQIIVKAKDSGNVIYRHSFSSLFQEWLATDEAKHVQKSFENVFLIPYPKTPVEITIEIYDYHGKIISSMHHTVDPNDILIRKAGEKPEAVTPFETLQQAADTNHCIHIAYVAEGYTADEMEHFLNDCKKASESLFRHEPFKAMQDRFNIVAVKSVSEESGTSEPGNGIWRRTALGSHVDTFYSDRPALHFTAETGWINDPNGLVYADGVYHLYYQWNPFGTEWGNMHWGHAVSRDLITWEHRPVALMPDEFGTVYSGCGWQDHEGVAGFGKDALLFYYTAAGGSNQWSTDQGNKHTQRLAISTDGGETLQKVGTVIEHIKGENRDPKIFWHAESGAYIMVLYLDGTEFAIFRSADLLHWQESQRFSAERMWECPGLFALPVEDRPGEKKWVFWSADGYYRIGDFDGYAFHPETEVLTGYDTKLG